MKQTMRSLTGLQATARPNIWRYHRHQTWNTWLTEMHPMWRHSKESNQHSPESKQHSWDGLLLLLSSWRNSTTKIPVSGAWCYLPCWHPFPLTTHPHLTSEMQSQGKNFVTDPNPPEGAQISCRLLPWALYVRDRRWMFSGHCASGQFHFSLPALWKKLLGCFKENQLNSQFEDQDVLQLNYLNVLL